MLAMLSAIAASPAGGLSLPHSKSVLKRNEELPSKQNAALAEEYSRGGTWVHKSVGLGVGRLVCRMTLKVEIYHRHPAAGSTLRGSLYLFLRLEEYGGADNLTMLLQMGPRSLASMGGAGVASLSKSASAGIRSAEVLGDNNYADLPSFSALAARMVFWYRSAKRLLRRELPWPREPGVAPVVHGSPECMAEGVPHEQVQREGWPVGDSDY
jgi:hypothetical protein